MPSAEDWKERIREAAPSVAAEAKPRAQTVLKSWGSHSRPALVVADDGNEYVIKGVQTGREAQISRELFTDQVVARVGSKLGAPVGRPSLVNVEKDLITAGGALQQYVAGLAHATRFERNTSPDRQDYAHTAHADNRHRFALLAVLYGWCRATDHQFIYGLPPAEPVVYSVDHGHFFGGPNWVGAQLSGMGPAAPDSSVVQRCDLQPSELKAARACLSAVADEDIAFAVTCPPVGWVGLDERATVAAWLSTARDQLLNG